MDLSVTPRPRLASLAILDRSVFESRCVEPAKLAECSDHHNKHAYILAGGHVLAGLTGLLHGLR
jgi:hypothetical protein